MKTNLNLLLFVLLFFFISAKKISQKEFKSDAICILYDNDFNVASIITTRAAFGENFQRIGKMEENKVLDLEGNEVAECVDPKMVGFRIKCTSSDKTIYIDGDNLVLDQDKNQLGIVDGPGCLYYNADSPISIALAFKFLR
jgi:hypothetical protein